MASRQGPLRFLGLWVVVPAGLYAVGYYVVGPQIGSRVPAIRQMAGDQFTMLNKRVRKIVTPVPPPVAPEQTKSATVETAPTDQTSTAEPPQTDLGGPQVEVSVRSTAPTRRTHRSTIRHRPIRKLHRQPKPKSDPETTDQGSYGGTQDQGSTTGGAVPPP